MSKLVIKDEMKTPQTLIHINHKISHLQYKYWFIILHYAKQAHDLGIAKDKKGLLYIPKKELTQILGYEPSKKDLLNDLEMLRSTAIQFNFLEKDGSPVRMHTSFISSFSVGSTRIGFEIPTVFLNAMLGIDVGQNLFDLVNFHVFKNLKGKYEAIIFKLCQDYINVGRTPYFELEKFREYIGLEPDEYPDFYELKRRTILKPIEVLNANKETGMTIDVVYKKYGKKIVGLQFLIKKHDIGLPINTKNSASPKKANAKKLLPTQNTASVEIRDERLDVFNDLPPTVFFSPEQKQNFLTTQSIELIKANIQAATKYIAELKAKNKAVSEGGIFQTAFNQKWGQKLLNQSKKDKQKEEFANAWEAIAIGTRFKDKNGNIWFKADDDFLRCENKNASTPPCFAWKQITEQGFAQLD